MKKLNIIFFIVVGLIMLNSCNNEEKETELIPDSKNIAQFERNSMSVTKIANGTEYNVPVKVKLQGPSSYGLGNDIQVSIAADESSTAIEGVHYSISTDPLTLVAKNDHLALYNFTMLTEGIETPLAASPILALRVTSATGDESVINSTKLINITLNYACPSYLAGTYNVETVREDGNVATWTETITEIGVGTYLTQYVGTWDPPLNPEGGLVFSDVCNVLSVPQQDLAYGMYSNVVQGTNTGSVDENGVFTLSYTIEFSDGPFGYTSTYTPVSK